MKKFYELEAAPFYQSQVLILGPVGYGPTTLPLRHSDLAMGLALLHYSYNIL